jgi:hypothetical protein
MAACLRACLSEYARSQATRRQASCRPGLRAAGEDVRNAPEEKDKKKPCVPGSFLLCLERWKRC